MSEQRLALKPGARPFVRFARGGVFCACAAVLVAGAAATFAQVDPKVIEQLQGRLGSGSADAGTQVDRSRERADDREAGVSRGATTEELELRRAQSRVELDAIYQASPVEREYRERTGDPSLRQFGYDLFRASGSGAGPVTGEVAESYILGPGDELVVTFQGATNESHTARVARDGRLIVASLPPVRAAGRSLGAVRTALSAATRQNLLGTDVYVSLGGVRSATIFIGGEVERPGQYQVTALSDIANAIARAGGVRKSGSLRNVRVVRRGASRGVDLYGLLGIGATPSVGVQDGDQIIVPVIGKTVAIAGAVARPGIYELRGSANVGEVVDYAGGALRPRGYEIAISRIGDDGREIFVHPQGANATLLAGDAVQVVGGSAGAAFDRVLLRGYVQNPGPRALPAAPTVTALLGSLDELRLGTYLPMAALVRRDPLTGMRNYEALSLRAALGGGPSPRLRGDDRLYVFSTADIAFINSAAVRAIIVGQPNPLPQCRSLDRLQTLVADTQSPRFNVITRGAFTVERGGQDVAASAGKVLSRGTGTSDDVGGSDAEQQAQTRFGQNAPAQTTGLMARQDEDGALCPVVFEELPELLPFLIENSVGIGGSVRRPGAYPVGGRTAVSDLLGAADGIVVGTGAVTLDIISTSANDQKRYDLPADRRDLAANLSVDAGDDVRVNMTVPAYETGAVLVTGEFRSPGLYTIRKGERLSALIARAGGLSDNAYPYGAVFTRRSVREAQQEGFKRTARELNSSLLALAAKKDTSGDAIAAAGQLIQTISATEAVGRMVVEADPRVLAARPDLDPILEGGDAVHVPKVPTYVLALGDVSNPGAMQFIPEKRIADYLAEAGGAQQTADDDRIFLVLPNGSAQPVRSSFWRRSNVVVPPGSTLIVPKNLDPLRSLSLIRDVAIIFGQVATSVASLAILADRRN